MAYIHVVDIKPGGQGVGAILHWPTPPGSNDAGMAWKAVGLAVGLLGNEPDPKGATEQAEKDAIAAGDIVELVATLEIDPTRALADGASLQDVRRALTKLADAQKARWQKRIMQYYAYYGYATEAVT